MIRLRDGALLAVTKLRTRKVRTVVTVVTGSLLFGGLVATTLIIGGVVQSTKNFTDGGLSDRYITNVQYLNSADYDSTSPELHARANQIYVKMVADKKAEAARLGIGYDASTEEKPVQSEASGVSYLNGSSLAAQQAIAELSQSQPTAIEKVEKLAAPYHPTRVYNMPVNTIPGVMSMMTDGKENFEKMQSNFNGAVSSDVSQGWAYLDSSIAAPFMLTSKQLASQKNVSYLPVIAPYAKVEAALGMERLSANASAQEQMERIAAVREKAASVTFTACYRNPISVDQITQARYAADDVKLGASDPSYQRPSLQYGLPSPDSCGVAKVVRDVRSDSGKLLDQKQRAFLRHFGDVTDPVQQMVTFRVVGISPNGLSGDSFSTVGALVSVVAGASLQGAWVVPQGMYDDMANKADYAKFEPSTAQRTTFTGQDSQLVEFATARDAKAFVTKVGCTGMDCNGGKPYITYFGSNSVLVDDMIKAVTKGLTIAVMIVAGIAALTMMGMV